MVEGKAPADMYILFRNICFPVYTNADCLPNKHNDLLLHVSQARPLIIGVTEIKPKNARYPVERSIIAIKDYELFDNLDTEGRGVGIYVHNSLSAVRLSGPVFDAFSESVWVSIRMSDNKSLIVGCIYRSPNSSTENDDHLHNLFRYVEAYRASHKLLMGDFNYPAIDWSTLTASGSGSAEKFLEAVNDSFLHQHVSAPTRYRIGNTPHTLDLIFTNEEHMVSNLEIGAPVGLVIMLL